MSDKLINYDPYSWETVQELTAKLLARLARTIPGGVDSLKVSLDDRHAYLTGMVHSEEARMIAVRTLAAFLKQHEIKDQVNVAGFLVPATDDWFIDDPFDKSPAAPRAGAGGTPSAQPIIRYPTISCVDDLIAGQEIAITIDLPSNRVDESDDAVVLAHLTPGWNKISVLAVVTSNAFEDLGGECQISVREDGTSSAATVTVRLRSDLGVGAEVSINVTLSVAGRRCALVPATLGKIESLAGMPTAFPAVALAIDPGLPSPALTVNIFGEEQELFWTWDIAHGPKLPAGPKMATAKLSELPQAFAARLIRRCPQMAPRDLKFQMGSIGDDIWKATPSAFKDVYRHLRLQLGDDFPIQFFMEQFHVPWEMMRPDDGNHLFLTHPVSRWPAQRSELPRTLPSGEKFSFVPEYKGDETLPAAREEQAWLCTNLQARKEASSKGRFLQTLVGENMPRIALVHFAGHGAAATREDDASLTMEDGSVYIQDVNHRDIRLGDRDRSMVILNACEAGAVSNSLSWVEGWGPVLAYRGFGAVVTPLWRVQDRAACELVIASVEGVYHRRDTIGEAFASARLAGASQSAAAYAFLVYGDVMARVE